MTTSFWLRRLHAAQDDDAGFTLIEVIVAMLILAVGLLGLMAVQVSSLSTVALAKQRQTAAQLANRVMEQMRALPYGVVTGGMSCNDLSAPTTDSNLIGVSVSSGSCTGTFKPKYDSSINEPLATTSGSTQVAPVSPHVQAASASTVGNVAYDVRSYVTSATGSDAGYWLTVVATWNSAVTKGATKSLATRSRLYSPKGCLATSTHPFSGPCQAFLYGNAGLVGGGLAIASTRTGLGLLDGLDVTSASLTFHGASNRLQSEQVVSAQSQASTSGAKVTGTSGSTALGIVTAVSAADTDPATGTATSPTSASTLSQVAGSTLARSGAGSVLTLAARPGDTGSTFSTMAAAGTPVCQDAQAAGVANGQACSSSTVTSAGAASAQLSTPLLGSRALVLLDLPAAAAGTTRSYTARYTSAGSTHCQSTSGVGCVSAGAARSLGSVRAGVLPGLQSGEVVTTSSGADVSAYFGTTPALVQVANYSDRAESEAGLGASGPVAPPTRTGTLTYWDGGAFQTKPITTAAASYPIPAVRASYSGGLTIDVSGSIAVGAAGAPVTGAAPCDTACTTKAGSGSVVATLTYVVYSGTTQVGGFTTALDLGSVLAQTTYKAAPVA